MNAQLSWTHYRILLKLSSKEEINYYIYITEIENLSYRKLNERIKSKLTKEKRKVY